MTKKTEVEAKEAEEAKMMEAAAEEAAREEEARITALPCACKNPWCEAVRRLDHGEIRSVRLHGNQLFVHINSDHVELNLGHYILGDVNGK